jgi:aspartate racemase
MLTIGLIGGMSFESSVEYERLLTGEVRRRLGGTHSAALIHLAFDFHEIEALQERGAWDEAERLLVDAALRLERAGAGLVVLCTNTMHRLAGPIERALSVPFLHIADATAAAVKAAAIATVGLLGTRYTMEQAFYRGRLEERHGLVVLVPGEPGRAIVHDAIYDELVRGIVTDRSRRAVEAEIASLVARGAEGVILGCTELELLVDPDDTRWVLFPTTRLHALAAVELALAP